MSKYNFEIRLKLARENAGRFFQINSILILLVALYNQGKIFLAIG